MIIGPKIFLLGPTASGKTELTKFCFDNFQLELINVDSTQVYRGFNIGSAKPSINELKQYPHNLIDILDPDTPYSVSKFKKDVDAICLNTKNNRIPFFTGGTMMYFNALEHPLDDIPKTSPKVRLKVEKEFNQVGLGRMYQRLVKYDPLAANNIHSSDTQRVLRAIEVFYESGKPISSFYKKSSVKNMPQYPLLKLGLYPEDRSILHKTIEERVEKMLNNGFVAEVERILSLFPMLSENFSSLRSVGYKQTYLYLKGKLSHEELKDKIVFATRQLAKRQLTWMRKMHNIEYFNPYEKNLTAKVKERIKKFLDQ